MLAAAEEFYQGLGFPYRIVCIVSRELNDTAVQKYDLKQHGSHVSKAHVAIPTVPIIKPVGQKPDVELRSKEEMLVTFIC